MDFTDFHFSEPLRKAIETMGFRKPTPVQEATIPPALEGKDIIATAQTGTGKTAAYLLPILQNMINHGQEGEGTVCLVLVPTRELAIQIDQQFQGFAYFTDAVSVTVYGGGDSVGWDYQKKALTEGVDFVIATPGRLLSHLALGYVDFSNLAYLVLDEADKMLDMGFYDDIMRIISLLPVRRQTIMLSATMPLQIRQLARKIMNNPVEVSIAVSRPADNITQAAYMIEDAGKLDLIGRLLKGKDLRSVLIFCSTKKHVRQLEKELQKDGFQVRGIQSDLDQRVREEIMRDFRNRKFQILVATDILSRGIDIEGIELVINYHVPSDPEDYIHRIGRTARADADGLAITFVNKAEKGKFQRIERFLGQKIYSIPAE